MPARSRHALFALAALTLTAGACIAQTRAPAAASPAIDAAYTTLLDAPQIKKLLADVKADDARTLTELRLITEIEAPPFKERERAEYMLSRFRALGLSNAAIDSEGSVVAVRKGSGKGPTLVVAAHLDTVFPPGTDVKIKEKDGRWYAPGIADDTRGLAVLLSWIKALDENRV